MGHDGTAATETTTSSTALVVHTPASSSSVDSSTSLVAPESINTPVSKFGTLGRLLAGVILSAVDNVTDILAITTFLKTSNFGFAKAMITCLSITMAIQLLFVFVQHKKKRPHVLLFEVLLTLTGIAPGVHAFRVARGDLMQANERVEPAFVLMFAKSTELTFEAVPGLVIQLYAVLTLPASSTISFVSISASAATVAFNVTIMYYERDTHAYNRALYPLFCGVFPEDSASRSLAIVALFVFSLAHAASKALGVALFWATFRGRAVLVYCACEVASFYLVKILRRDFNIRVPLRGILANAVLSAVGRFVVKIMLDFTGFMVLRHPVLAGGMHFTLSLVWSQISSVCSVVLYQAYYTGIDENGGKMRDKISATALYGIMGAAVFVWFLSFSAFIKLINKEYLHTFFGTMTGPQFEVHNYRVGNERVKMTIFTVNVLYWESIYDEVKAYTHANWDRWKEEKPDWFTEQWIASIPDEFIPRVEKGRRRSSALSLALGLPEGPEEAGIRITSSSKKKRSSKVEPAKGDSGSAGAAASPRHNAA